MSETAFKVSAILKDFMQADKAENLTSLFEKLASEAAGNDYLNQKDKIDLITRIDSVKTDINNNLWKVVALLITVMGICSAAIIHYR